MKRTTIALMFTLLLAGHTLVAHGGQDIADQPIKTLVETIKASNINGFRACLTQDFANDMTPAAVAALIEPFAPRLAGGYSLENIGSLKQQDMTVDLYKVTANDGGDDLLVRAILENGKVGGLLITAPFE